MIETEPRPPVRAIVASFLFTDLVGFSKGSATEQYAAKAALSACLRNHLAPLRETDYWIKDTGDGALIAFLSNPEHALYVALAIAQDYGQTADGTGVPLTRLRTGLHLGTVKETIDIEARPNYIGDGINATKRIMDFADPGQIAASRNFFEAVANLDTAYAALFQHLGAPDDKHGRAHELYAIAPSAEVLKRLKLDFAATTPQPPDSGARSTAKISAKQDSPPPVSVQSPTASNRAAETMRTGLNPLLAVIVLVAAAAAAYFGYTRLEGPAPAVHAVTAQPVTGQSATAPTSTNGSEGSPASGGERAARSPTSPASPPVLNAAAPGGAVQAPPPSTATTNPTRPVIAAPTSGRSMDVDTKSKISAAPSAPVRIPVAPGPGSAHCSQIVEKAALGEPLSQEEKRELATCR